MPRRSIRVALLVVGVVLVVIACGRGQRIAAWIETAGAPMVDRVDFRSANPFEGKPDEVYVYLVPGATPEQAATFWCDVVARSGATENDPRVVIWRGEPPTQGVNGILSTGETCDG